MPVFLSESRSVLFIHVPKAAGTTVERAFKNAGWAMRFHETKRGTPHHVLGLQHCSPQHFHRAPLEAIFDVTRFDLRFMIVREPIARFRSEYLMRTRKQETPRLDAAAVESWAFRQLDRLSERPYLFDNHLRPQHEFLLENTAVFRLEDGLDAALGRLGDTLGSPLMLPAKHGQVSVKRSGVPSHAVEISPALEERLRALYAQDYATFGY